MMDYADVPMPPRDGKGRPSKYKFGDMEVGDRFLVDAKNACSDECKEYAAAKSYARYHKAKGLEFRARKVAEGKVMIWRVA